MDGVLLDTEGFYTIVQQKIASRYGKTFDWTLKSKMLGKKAHDAALTFVRELDLEGQLDPAEFLKERERMLDEMFPTSQLLPGVERLLRYLKASGVEIAVATSSTRKGFTLKTSRHGEVFSLFSHIVTGDEVKHGKPAPDIFLTAAKRFVPAPSSDACLVIEDAPAGIVAAKAAGMHALMVPDERLDKALVKGYDQLLYSLENFDPETWGIPAFEA